MVGVKAPLVGPEVELELLVAPDEHQLELDTVLDTSSDSYSEELGVRRFQLVEASSKLIARHRFAAVQRLFALQLTLSLRPSLLLREPRMPPQRDQAPPDLGQNHRRHDALLGRGSEM